MQFQTFTEELVEDLVDECSGLPDFAYLSIHPIGLDATYTRAYLSAVNSAGIEVAVWQIDFGTTRTLREGTDLVKSLSRIIDTERQSPPAPGSATHLTHCRSCDLDGQERGGACTQCDAPIPP